jgi:hypothetical protein
MKEMVCRAGRKNATFLVEIEMSLPEGATDALREEVQRWLSDEWAPMNQLWRRVYRNAGRACVQDLLYSEEFSSPPSVLRGGSKLRLVMEGRSCSQFWRDWLVARLIPDVRSRFPLVGETQIIRNFEQV